ncbi:MAG: GDP-L-fucose synthase, partial [Acidobacteria bacterium]|nr:GDP-L-fucose synthase [Acidobacteriota bacterium]
MSYWAKKRVLVTGGAGFVGTNVVAALRAAGGVDITIVRSHDYDLTRETEVVRLLQDTRPEVVFHLAGYVGGILANKERPADFFYRNLMMGTLLIHYASRMKVERVVAAGAGCGYPENASTPLREESFWDGYPQKESAPYALAKRMLIVQAEAYHRQYGFVTVVGVPGNVYGPYDNFDLYQAHVIPALVRKFVEAVEDNRPEVVVWGSGRPTRDFVYVEDVARGLLLAAERYSEPAMINLSSGLDTPVRQVVDTLTEITGFTGRVVWDTSKPDGQLRRVFDISRARRELGYESAVNLREGLRRTVEWFRKHR